MNVFSLTSQVSDVSLTGGRAGVSRVCVVTAGHVGSCPAEVSAASARRAATSGHTAPSPPAPSRPSPSSCSGASGRDFTSPSRSGESKFLMISLYPAFLSMYSVNIHFLSFLLFLISSSHACSLRLRSIMAPL